MAIKTTGEGANRRIITKLVDGQRRVSCSCCQTETGCCMYPADQLGIGYLEADLPDEVRITIAGTGGDSRIAARSGSEYSYGSYGGIANLKLGVDDGAWVFIPNADNLSAYVQQCLNGEDAEFTVEDTFADTYSYTLVFNGNTIESGTITRTGLCTWSSGEPLFTGVAYSDATNGFGDQGAVLQWATLDGNEFQAIKTPPHNSPEGTYVAVGGLYNGAVATVFP